MKVNRLRTVAVLLILVVCFTEHSIACKDDPPPPVNCAVSSWGNWGSCSKTCDLGSQSRSRHVTTNSAHGGAGCPSLSQSRSCREAECPIDCQWGEWGEWTDCSSYGTKSRFRNITTPSMFDGWDCAGTNIEVAGGCSPPVVPEFQCETDYILCRDVGNENHNVCTTEITCVRDTLACNGDDDCTDHSDELHCDDIFSPCSTPKDRIPSVDVVGAAFNILRNEETGTILDNWRYDGRCTIVTSGDHGVQEFRQPANILSYRFQAKADTTFSMNSYACTKNFIQEEREEQQNRMELGFSFIFLSSKVAYSSDSKRTTIIENGSKLDSKYFKTRSRIEVAQFRTLRNNLFTTYLFRRREAELPEHFDYAEYSKIITDFGTHYYSSGVLGGEFETIYRYDRSELTESTLTEEEQKHCIESELSVWYKGASGGVGSSVCTTNALSQRYGGSFIAAAKEVVSSVRGGSSDTAASLTFTHQETPSKEDFDAWAETIKDNPAVVDFMLAPISAVFASSAKKANMERALYEYMIRFDPDVCPPECLNEGAPIVVDEGKECKCICAVNYSGPACRDKN